jgi:hypothetical protein
MGHSGTAGRDRAAHATLRLRGAAMGDQLYNSANASTAK